jgi:hypothetical protein
LCEHGSNRRQDKFEVLSRCATIYLLAGGAMSKFDRARRRARAAKEVLPLWARNRIMLEGYDVRSRGIGQYVITKAMADRTGQLTVRTIALISWDLNPAMLENVLVIATETIQIIERWDQSYDAMRRWRVYNVTNNGCAVTEVVEEPT